MKTLPWAALVTLGVATMSSAAEPPAPWGPTPTPLQSAWFDTGFYAFVHFSVNTFTDKEWGYGDESPDVFNPTDFNPDQICAAVKAGGMKGLILTAKHHDGFCLWPTQFSEHSIQHSKWRDGKGDVVGEMAAAAKRAGLKFGLYLSPWDRNHAEYAQPGYVTYYKNQIRELLTHYGPLFEMWFDGANGGDGFYGGAKEKRQIPGGYYDFPGIAKIIRGLDPGCIIWGAGSSGDVTWGGSESGVVPDPCWPTMNNHKRLMPGDAYVPSEADVSIRPGWFYHASEDNRVKTAAQLADIWFASLGRGANLILNLPPDRRGQIHDNDVAALKAFHAWHEATFGTDLAAGATATADNVRGNDARFDAAKLLDGDPATYWATDDGTTTATVTLQLPRATSFNVVALKEAISLGQRIEDTAIEVWTDGAWQPWGKAANIGPRRFVRGTPVTTDRLRVRIEKSQGCICLSDLKLHREPFRLAAGTLQRDKAGTVSLAGAQGVTVRYTTDGSTPTAASPLFAQPLPLPHGGTLKLLAFGAAGQPSGDVLTQVYGLPKAGWRVVKASSQEPDSPASAAIDDNPATMWHTQWRPAAAQPPHEIILDLGASVEVTAATYLSRQDDARGRCCANHYSLWLSDSPDTWGAPAAEGQFGNIAANPVEQVVTLAKPVTARYLRWVFRDSADGAPFVTAVELGVMGR